MPRTVRRECKLGEQSLLPRLIIPTATIAVSVVDLMISFGIMVGMMIWYAFVAEHQHPRPCAVRPACIPSFARSVALG